ncbi:hypothetical protein VNO80_12336 [Phaseolus coccineus]|uniref:Uncharacterized protein n=1 Tax=Phaseolus coccineus TaxID=3886 RepID=A0AAN9MZP4_PHACN
MGNSIRRVGLLNTVGVGEDQPFHYQLGTKVSIYLSERRVSETPNKKSEEWTMSYTVDVSTCELTLTKEEGGKGLRIKTHSVIPGKTGDFVVCFSDLNVTESDARKNKNEQELPHEVTLAHYFASSGRINDYSRNKTDVGLSVVVKIRATNGNLDVTVEGPEQHPALGLRYLFEEAMRSKIWKPTLCPHCANIQKPRSMMTWQSDSDDSESVPVARRHGGSQNNLRKVNNGGRFNGNGNGNYTEIKNMIFGGKWSTLSYCRDSAFVAGSLCLFFVPGWLMNGKGQGELDLCRTFIRTPGGEVEWCLDGSIWCSLLMLAVPRSDWVPKAMLWYDVDLWPSVLEIVRIDLLIIKNFGLALRKFPQISNDVVGLVDEWAAGVRIPLVLCASGGYAIPTESIFMESPVTANKGSVHSRCGGGGCNQLATVAAGCAVWFGCIYLYRAAVPLSFTAGQHNIVGKLMDFCFTGAAEESESMEETMLYWSLG